MLETKVSLDELALESVELLPDRDTMQVVVGSFASNAVLAFQSATSGDVSDVNITVTPPPAP